MSLLDYWLQDQKQISSKTVQQIISFAGEGHLRDDSATSNEFRELLKNIPPEMLQQYAHQCLEEPFSGSGYVLQDIINEIGSRLDFDVKRGRYQGKSGLIGFDGLWKWRNGHAIIVEVKTTDAYRININTIADYRKALIQNGEITESNSSILIVVGREDTGDLEAQIRGSRHAWDMRLISVESLIRLMLLKQSVEDPQIIQKMYEILVPMEFTKLDEIIEIMFSTAEDMKVVHIEEEDIETGLKEAPSLPVAYHKECVARIESHLHKSFMPRTRVLYSTSNNDIALVCIVSREYVTRGKKVYWFGFHPYQAEFLKSADKGYIALGCGSKEIVLLIEFNSFEKWLKDMNKTERPNKYYWHVLIDKDENRLILRLKNQKKIELTSYLI